MKRVINFIDKREFFQNYWEKKSFVTRNLFQEIEIFTYNDFNSFLKLNYHHFDFSSFRIVQDGEIIPETEYTKLVNRVRLGDVKEVEIEKVEELSKNGATLIVTGADKMNEKLSLINECFADWSKELTQINIYYANESKSQGFNLHYDTHEIIILQVEGQKKWFLSDEFTFKYPLKNQKYINKTKPIGKLNEIVLNKGDLLYIPRGMWHYTQTIGEPSLHLTINFFPKSGTDFIKWFISSLDSQENLRKNIEIDHLKNKYNSENLIEILEVLREHLENAFNDKDLITNAYNDYVYNKKTQKIFNFPIK